VILQLATNDAKNTTWNERLFEHDYIEMVNSYITLPSKPKVFISIPPPYYSNISLWHIRGDTINKKIPLILKSILKKINTEIIQNQHIFPVELIDNFEALGGSELKKTELFLDFSKKILYKTSTNDGCHPNNLGYEVMANNVHNALKNTTFKGHLSHLNLLLDSKI
jgi:lysophospholipase L1-like esterase